MKRDPIQDYTVVEASDELFITPTRYAQWRAVSAAGGTLRWNRQGLTKMVPPEVLANALETYLNYSRLIVAGRLTAGAQPKSADRINWEQTTDVTNN